MKWKATLPRETPPEGMVQVVIGAKKSNGYRTEIIGCIPEDKAAEILGIAILSVTTKPKSAAPSDSVEEGK